MSNVVGVGQISLMDLNDAIIAGIPPSNPTVGTLWIDESQDPPMLKKWNGEAWIDLGELDPDLSVTIEEINETLGNMANDNLINFQERQVIKDKLTEIIGYVIADTVTSLPSVSTLDNSGKGSFWSVRKSARNVGIPISHATYTNVATRYNNLKSYLESLTPIVPWDTRNANADVVVPVTKSTFRDMWLQYYLAVDALAELTAQKIKENNDELKDDVDVISRDLDSLTGRVTTVESKVTDTAIVNTVTRSEAWVEQINVINDKVSKTEFENLQIGGRNLLKNTSDEWTTLQLSDSQYYFQQETDTRLEVGVTYTFSILVEKVSDDDVPIRVGIGTGEKGNYQRDKEHGIPVEFGKRFTLTFTITENDIANGYEYFAWRLRNERQITTIRFKEVKLEKGNKATDWTPAPEDMQDKLDNLKIGGRNLAPVTGMQIVTYHLNDASNRGEQVDERTFKIYANPPNGISFLFGYAEVSQGKEYILNADMSDTISSFAGVVVYDENKNILEEDGLLSGDLKWESTYRSYLQLSEEIVKTPLKFKVEDSRVKFVRLRLGVYRGNVTDRDVLIREPELREGNKTLGWTPAPEDVQDKLDNLEIGGRNLLLNTNQQFDWNVTSFGGSYSKQHSIVLFNEYNILRGKTVTLSFWAKTENLVYGTTNPWFGFEFRFNYEDGTRFFISLGGKTVPEGTNDWKKYSITREIPDKEILSASQFTVLFRDATGNVSLKNIKLELGNKATDWTPAPEDVQSQIGDAIADIEIGGRNLNRNSNNFSESVWNSYDGGSIQVTENVTVDEWGATDATQVRISEGNRTNVLKGYKDITGDTDTVEGETYTVSLYVKNLREYQMSVNINGLNPRPTVYLDPYEAKRIVVTGKRSSSRLQLQFWSHHTNYYTEFIVWRAQVEKGNKATDWTPAPEDIEENIDILATKINNVEQEITADKIVTTITESITFQNILDSKADTESLGSFVTKDELDELSGEVDGKIDDAIQGIDFSPYATKLELEETSRNITAKFSATGGMNLIKNSIGFAGSSFWSDFPANISTIQNNELDILGFGSGFIVTNSSYYSSIYQTIPVIPNQIYTISFYENISASTGYSIFRVHDGTSIDDPQLVSFNNSSTTDGFEFRAKTFIPTSDKIMIRLGGHLTDVVFTGLMLNIGDVPLQWSLATGEVYNTNIRMDINGIRVSQLDKDRREIGYTQITPDEFAGYYDSDGDGTFEKVFYLNGEETVTKKFRALNEITMGGIKVININSGGRNGWAFVPMTE